MKERVAVRPQIGLDDTSLSGRKHPGQYFQLLSINLSNVHKGVRMVIKVLISMVSLIH